MLEVLDSFWIFRLKNSNSFHFLLMLTENAHLILIPRMGCLRIFRLQVSNLLHFLLMLNENVSFNFYSQGRKFAPFSSDFDGVWICHSEPKRRKINLVDSFFWPLSPDFLEGFGRSRALLAGFFMVRLIFFFFFSFFSFAIKNKIDSVWLLTRIWT